MIHDDLDLLPETGAVPLNGHVSLGSRFTPGASFILDTPAEAPALWGVHGEVLWAEGESLILTGPPGAGKTTVAQQVVLGLLGLRAQVLGYPVTRRAQVLYLAMDRPRQIARSFRRMVTDADRDSLAGLTVWEGPPLADVAKDTSLLLAMAQRSGARVIVLDSLKDAALGLTSDEVGAAVNRAIQTCLASGVDVLILHHQVKRNSEGGKPTSLADVYGSAWITAGAGSVILLHGEAGAPTVELRHLKSPQEPVGPFQVEHDHHAGTSTRLGHVDALEWLRRQHGPVTAQHLAQVYGDQEPRTVQRARRDLDRLHRDGLANRHEGTKGGNGGGTPTTYTRAAHPDQDTLEDPS